MKKRGLSPVIATVLLIVIALVLALIIFLWARSFTSEQLQKFDEPIENACENIYFEAEGDVDGIYVVNKGNVPLSGMAIQGKNVGSVSSVDRFKYPLLSGEVTEDPLGWPSESNLFGELVLIPVILGESEDHKKEHKCDDKYGIVIEVV